MNERILVVDDEEFMRDAIRLVLEREGYAVAVAVDGQEALEVVRERKPDLVITDITMPRMGGYELLTALRKDPKTQNLPVILATQKDSTSDVLTGWGSGADYYITKPFASEILKLSVELVLKEAGGRAELAKAKAAQGS